MQRFVKRRIVRGEDLPRFEAAIESAVRLRNSIPVEVALLISVYTLGLWFWNSRFGIESPTWYANPGGRWHLTPAGSWYVFVSIPILQFCASALVFEALRLVSLSLAGVQTEPASGSNSPRSLRRARFPG